MVKLTCLCCGREYERAPWDVRRGRISYCSRDCYYKSRVGKSRPDRRRASETRKCAVCDRFFIIGGRGNKPHDAVFCSRRCTNQARYRSGTRANVLSAVDAAYIAGFVDGEGSVILYMRHNKVAMRVIATNTKKSVLDWIAASTGVGSVTTIPRSNSAHATGYCWTANAEAAESVLKQIRAYLRLKSVQAELAIDTQSRLRDPAFNADRSWHLAYAIKMRVLNKRGPVAA